MKRSLLTALVLGFAFHALPVRAQEASSEEEAGDVSELDKDVTGILRDRVRPVTGHRLLMGHRFELSPTVGITFRDPFFIKVLLGINGTYHFNEAFALALDAFYNISIIAGSARICIPQGSTLGAAGCRSPTLRELTTSDGKTPQNRAAGYLTFWGDLNFQWSPIYGKLSMFSEGAVNFNLFLFAGPSFVLYGPTNQFAVGGNVGIGVRLLINRWLGVRLQLRDMIYEERVFDQIRSATAYQLRNQLMVEAGFSMFFPTNFEERR